MPTAPAKANLTDTMLLSIARDIVMDIQELPAILEKHRINADDFETISQNATFHVYLKSYQQEWNSPVNTEHRVKIKAAAIVEMYLEEANKRLHAIGEKLGDKNDLLKTIAKLAGQGFQASGNEGGAESVTINIGIGGGAKVTIQQEVTPKVTTIEHGSD